MGDDPKKPELNELPELDVLSEEDIFSKTKLAEANVPESSPDGAQEAPQFSQEPIEAFEDLEDVQSSELEQSGVPAPSFEPEKFDELSNQEPVESPQFAPELSGSIPSVTAPSEQTSKTIDSIKNYSESLNSEAPTTAQLPFTLRIEGKLSAQESEKLLDVLAREKMDIREVDIEPQLEAGKILIPRISEYAGVLLIQALRGIRAKIFFQPSDISTTDLLSDSVPNSPPADFDASFGEVEKPPSAESLPVTRGDDLPQLGVFQVLDTLIVSGMLSTKSVEAINSSEFTSLTESLIRELKFKAVRRGARGITHLSIQLTPMTLPTDFRVTVSGTVVK